MQNWYNLPTYYDVSFSHEMSEELAFLKELFGQYDKGSPPKLLEPACGTGRLITPLVRSGFDCTGFDMNEYALAYLKKNWIEISLMPIFSMEIWLIFRLKEKSLMVLIVPLILSDIYYLKNRLNSI